MAKPQSLKMALGAIFFLSICFVLYYFEAIGTALKISKPVDVNGPALNDTQNAVSTSIKKPSPASTKKPAPTSVKKLAPTSVKKSSPTKTKKPAKPTQTRIDPKKLDVEQIEADFPMGYKNPRAWFLAIPAPNERDLLHLLSEEERDMLPSLGAEAQLSQKQLRKINSFYGIAHLGREHSWQDHIDSLDDDGLAPLTKWAQNYIYNHQHPASCEGKKFYILEEKAPWYGLGAAVRVIFRELELAISAGRILVYDPHNPPGGHLMSGDCGAYRGRNASLECVLEDITSCASYVTAENSVREISHTDIPGGNKYVPPVPSVAMITYMKATGLSLSGAFLRYWWHAQMYGYVFRPNRAALDRILEMRLNKTLHVAANTHQQVEDGKAKLHTVPFPLPPNTVSMHIRHGDKAIEGRLISTRDYIVAAERFILRNPINYRKRAFVTTEDPGAIEEIKRTRGVNPVTTTFANFDWYWFYSNIPRFDGSPFDNLRLSENRTDAMLMHVMQLGWQLNVIRLSAIATRTGTK